MPDIATMMLTVDIDGILELVTTPSQQMVALAAGLGRPAPVTICRATVASMSVETPVTTVAMQCDDDEDALRVEWRFLTGSDSWEYREVEGSSSRQVFYRVGERAAEPTSHDDDTGAPPEQVVAPEFGGSGMAEAAQAEGVAVGHFRFSGQLNGAVTTHDAMITEDHVAFTLVMAGLAPVRCTYDRPRNSTNFEALGNCSTGKGYLMRWEFRPGDGSWREAAVANSNEWILQPVVSGGTRPTVDPPHPVGRPEGATLPDNGISGTDSRTAEVAEAQILTEDQVDEPVRRTGGPNPVYPQEMQTVGIDGSVRLRFVVGTNGRAEPASIQVVSSTNKAFEPAAIKTIRESTFKPAMMRGQAVRQLVEQNVSFKLSG